MSGHLGEHLEIGECDHILLKEQEVDSKSDVDHKHHWTEVVVAMMVLSMVILATVVLSVMFTILFVV